VADGGGAGVQRAAAGDGDDVAPVLRALVVRAEAREEPQTSRAVGRSERSGPPNA
ncbi:MAG: hypothetical protein QOD69_3297, partial [Solirubrobacteraceae bacterium]|nr:hypothetical protein [Solirubrobacteraceae bacterium]